MTQTQAQPLSFNATRIKGAWIRQIASDNNERIIAISSRTLTDTEKRYSNIERECLAVAYGLEKFEFYLLGRTTSIETDHSPLEHILRKSIREAPGRVQRLLLRCLRFDVQVKYQPGKTIPVADALSRVCFAKSQQIKDNTVHFVTDTPCPIDINAVKSASALDLTIVVFWAFSCCPIWYAHIWIASCEKVLGSVILMSCFLSVVSNVVSTDSPEQYQLQIITSGDEDRISRTP